MASAAPLLLLFLSLLFLVNAFPLSAPPPFLLLPLNHTLSQTQTAQPVHHLLKLSSLRSTARFRSFRHHHHNRRHRPVPLSPGSDYTLPLTIGQPPQTVQVYLDTGSDVVWMPCARFECILCEDKPRSPSPPLIPTASLSDIPCASPACSTAHSSAHSSDLCAIAGCSLDDLETSSCQKPCPPFYYAYADGSLIARLVSSRLHLQGAGIHFQNFTFGCAHSTLAEPVGVAGFGRGALSFPGQIAARRFSYCLVPHRFSSPHHRPSPLLLGRKPSASDEDDAGVSYTPLLPNPRKPYFYYVGLEGALVGNRWISAPESLRGVDSAGNGGLVVDSGTTFTTLPGEFFQRVKAEFVRGLGGSLERASDVEEASGVGPCYYVEGGDWRRTVPGLVLVFRGNASVELPKESYFFDLGSGGALHRGRAHGCFLVMGATEGENDDEGGGPAGLLGNFQQQDVEVIYDLEKRRIGFKRRDCGSMWDSL
ncbi:probable aspartyl protease At4g16563 [Nymphaea colorata]|uniref:Peptidase A1 domain-containing protein n=1 Tax=Nymphaea colorata TaxID=210225 RepID=A0A5K1CUT3_9MAGN|nr:probable aspartyl protease At4g16563 [Nymphaea colorata]